MSTLRSVARVLAVLFAVLVCVPAIPVGLSIAGVSVYTYYNYDYSIDCGGEEVPREGHLCAGSGGFATYEELKKKHRREVERAPALIGFGTLTALLGATGLFFLNRHFLG
ncbi:hypothetical protein [Streptomyces albipurpureus]|uniref:Integral membrane protein n=1 Tax=Streptomyces albipurpureus TaxID=2897419 RepID=A0ABT0UM11_9ACTN|nr:hypothetical protein [Streptomyces sp. CWNU-1]MCM2388301.1 hypothetical protein [Streptomyces sp. CWNU-1]